MADSTTTSGRARHQFVYLILSHGRTEQLFRLVRVLRLASPDSAIVLHHDAKSPPLDQSAISGIDSVYFVEPRHSVQWGDASHVDALLAAFTYIERHIDYSWLSLISGQDYPLRSLRTIEDELRSSTYDAYVKAAPVANGPYRLRYLMRYRRLPRFAYYYRIPGRLRTLFGWLRKELNSHQSLVRFEGAVRGTPLRLGLRAAQHPFVGGFVCYKGSDWFTLSRRAVEYLIEFRRERPEITDYYRETFMPSESYFQTVLWNSSELTVCDDNRRFIIWDTVKLAHPKTLTVADLDAIRIAGKDFGRKFDASVDSAVLDVLDQFVLGLHP